MASILDFASRWGAVTDANTSGDFDQSGANARNSWDSILPSISPLPGLPGSQGGTTVSSGSTIGGGHVGSPGGSANTFPQPASTSSPASASTAPATSGLISAGSIADYFSRGVLVILGMIFVAVGLHMFAPSYVPDVRRVGR